MQYRTLNELAQHALIEPIRIEPLETEAPRMSRRQRLERWADVLARDPRRFLSSIEDIEYGPRSERDAKRADNSPLTVAYEDSVLREQGLTGDRVGDAVDFFDLSHDELHDLVCYCHHGFSISPLTMAVRIRALARRGESRFRLTLGRALFGGCTAAALMAAVVFF